MQSHSYSESPVPSNPEMDARGRKIRRFGIIVACVLALGFFIVHFMKSLHESRLVTDTEKSAAAPPLIDVITVTPAPAIFALKLPGETAAWFESVIYARVDGYVAKWYADIGDHVRKSQVLATIETPDLDAQLDAAQAKLKAAEALVDARQADADFAKTTYERWRDSPKGVVSEQEREAKKAGYSSAVAQLNEAEAQVALDRSEVDRYTVLTKFKQVTAPYDGRITERRIDIGNLVTAGSSASTTPLYRMSQDDPIRIFADVPQNIAGDMKVGTKTAISVPNTLGQIFRGKITRTADAINTQSRTLRVEVDIVHPGATLIPGMYVDVSFNIPSEGLLQVPASALVFRVSGPEVAVVDKEHRVHFHKITIARDNGNTVEIGSGLSVNDKVALNISNQIAEGEKVEEADPEENTANDSATSK